MARSRPNKGKRYFTASEANARLPLVRVIVRDIVELAADLMARHERLRGGGDDSESVRSEIDRDQERLQGYVEELHKLGAELKDYRLGLVDFPGLLDGREVCLCWKLGEADVAYWHETDAGYAGRRPLAAGVEAH